MLRGGPESNKILDYQAAELPAQLYTPAAPLDLSTDRIEVTWRVARYVLSQDEGSYDIQSYYDFDRLIVP